MEAKPTLIIKDYEDPKLWTALEELDKQEAAVKRAAWIISLVTRRIMIYLNNSFPRELLCIFTLKLLVGWYQARGLIIDDINLVLGAVALRYI